MSARVAALVLLSMLTLGAADAQNAPLTTAREAAAAGDYTQATRAYQQALDQGAVSAPLLFNLGNAWLRLGQPGRAILNYERALVLAPQDAAVLTNLTAARQRAGIEPEKIGSWQLAARVFSLDTYLWACLGAVWVLCAALVLLCLNRRSRNLARLLILIAAVTLCVSADAAALCWSDLYRAVIVQGPAILHLAPAEAAAASGTLREGEVVWLQNRYVGFRYVRTGDGHTGWVSEAAAVPVRGARL